MKNSVQLKLNLDLNSDLGRNLFAGISDALAGTQVEQLEVKPTIVLVKEEVTDTAAPVVDKPQRASRAKVKPEEAKEEAAPEDEDTPAAEAAREEAPSADTDGSPLIVLGDIKAEIAKKVSKHRDAIKAELTRLGAENSDKMPKEHYSAFHRFLTEL